MFPLAILLLHGGGELILTHFWDCYRLSPFVLPGDKLFSLVCSPIPLASLEISHCPNLVPLVPNPHWSVSMAG